MVTKSAGAIVPQMPPKRWMGMASTTSSTLKMTSILEAPTYTIPATKPIMRLTHTSIIPAQPEMDTRPHSTPLFILRGSIF